MAMIAIAVEEIVFALLENRRRPDGQSFLPAIEMAKPADALAGLGVFLIGAFFEAADEHHHPQALALVIAGNRGSYLKSRPFLDFVDNGHVVALPVSALDRVGAIPVKFSWIHVHLQWLHFKSSPLRVAVEL